MDTAEKPVEPPLLTERSDRAYLLASELHRFQTRKARNGRPTPYMVHLIGVASYVLDMGGDEDMYIAALLHDSVEDQLAKFVSMAKADEKFNTISNTLAAH